MESNNKDAAVVTNPDDVPVKINGEYVMYYGQSEANNGTFIAYSTDMVHWTAGTPINLDYPNSYYPYEICVAVTDYQTTAGGPTIPNIDLFVAGTLNGTGHWFYAISELEMSSANPGQVVDQMSDAVLSPAEPYEETGQTQLAVFMNSITFYNGQWWMYYGAGDDDVALANAQPDRPLRRRRPARHSRRASKPVSLYRIGSIPSTRILPVGAFRVSRASAAVSLAQRPACVKSPRGMVLPRSCIRVRPPASPPTTRIRRSLIFPTRPLLSTRTCISFTPFIRRHPPKIQLSPGPIVPVSPWI